MTRDREPSDEELERAERIHRLRTGGERSRGHEVREKRREQATDGADATATDGADAGAGGTAAEGDADVLELAAELPEDGSLFVVPVREALRRQFNKVAEQLHLQYGFEYGGELDAERHVRPLALSLGVEALEEMDVTEVRELLSETDGLEVPGEDEE